jgi:aconitase A
MGYQIGMGFPEIDQAKVFRFNGLKTGVNRMANKKDRKKNKYNQNADFFNFLLLFKKAQYHFLPSWGGNGIVSINRFI